MKFKNKFMIIICLVVMILTSLPINTVYAATWKGPASDDSNYYWYYGYAYMYGYSYEPIWGVTYEYGSGRWTDSKPYMIQNDLYDSEDVMLDRYVGKASDYGFIPVNNVWAGQVGRNYNHTIWPNVDHTRKFKVTYRRTKTTPQYKSTSIAATYASGNNYWIKPNTTARVTIRGYQQYPGTKVQLDDYISHNYIRLYGNNKDARATINTSGGLNYFSKTSVIGISSGGAARTDGNRNLYTTFNVRPTENNVNYNVQTYHLSENGKRVGYVNTGKYIRTDGTAPTVSASVSSRGWGSTNIPITLTYSDSRSGVNTRQYAWSTSTSTPTSWSNYSSTITLATQGTWYLHYKTTDKVGNVRTGRFGPYRIDSTAPSGIFSPNSKSWTKDDIPISFNPSDSGGSGVELLQSRLNTNGTWGSWSGYTYGDTNKTFTLSNTGTYQIQVRVRDNAGNIKDITSGTYYIDKTASSFSSASLLDYRYKDGNDYWVRPNDTSSYTIRGSDSASGISLIYARLYHTGLQSSLDELRVNYSFITNQYNVFNTSSYVTVTNAINSYSSGNTREAKFTLKPVSDNTDFDLHYYLTDIARNTLGYIDTNMNLRTDGTAPIITFSPNGREHTHDYSVNVKTTDPRSGVKSIKYKVTSSTAKPITWDNGSSNFNIDINGEGSFYIHVEAEDNVGNIRYTRSNPLILDNEAPTLIMSHEPDPTMIFVETIVNIKVSDPEDDLMNMSLSLIDTEGNEIPIDGYTGLKTNDILSFNFTPEIPGSYKVKAVLSDIYPTNSRTFTYTIPVLDASIEGQVNHTDTWEENRQKYNIYQTGNPENPRTYDMFFPGEKFMLEANILNSFVAEKVDVKLLNTEFTTTMINTENDIWEGFIWDESMMGWEEKTLDFEFTVTYFSGYQKVDTVRIYVGKEHYFRLKQGF